MFSKEPSAGTKNKQALIKQKEQEPKTRLFFTPKTNNLKPAIS